jgi:hypothetical protein
MPTLTADDVKLERAHAQSRVISANLDHLVSRVAEIDPQLRRELSAYAVRFNGLVRQLEEACDRAADGTGR